MHNRSNFQVIYKLFSILLLTSLLFSSLSLKGVSIAKAQEATNTPTPEATETPNIILIQGTVNYNQELGNAVIASLQQATDVLANSKYFAITDIRYMGSSWTLVSIIGFVQVNKNQEWSVDGGSWYGLALLETNTDGSITSAIQGTVDFSGLLLKVPSEYLDPTAKYNLDPLNPPNVSSQSGYIFPWQSGTSMEYGTEGVHVDGNYNGNTTGWMAVDMESDGNTQAGHAPNRLIASSSGTITYKCPDANNVMILMGGLSYTHLVDNSNLYVGKSFNQGDDLGQLKTGTFGTVGQGCGWATQGSNWFHVHWGFPNSNLQVEGWTLNMSTQKWTNGSTSLGPNDSGWIRAGNSGGGGGSACPGPSLSSPSDGYISTNQNINFSWSALSGCTFSGYTIHIKDTPNMDSGGNTIRDSGVGGLSWSENIATQWNNMDLYWGIRAANAPSGASWSVRRFRIQPGSGPSTPSNPNLDNATISRTNDTTLTWSTNGSNCSVHIWGGSIDISPGGGCSSLALHAQRGGSYTWQVTASNSYGNSTGPTWHFNVRPYAPSNLSYSVVSSSQINLNWTLSSDDDSTNIDGYDIYKNGQMVGSVNKGENTYHATSLACNTNYSFYILSKRQNVVSDASNVVSANTFVCGPASPGLNSPANNITFGRTDNLSFSWNTASGASQYRVHFWGGPNNDVFTGWTSGTSVSIGSQWGGVYQWNVEASNGSISSYSDTRTLTVLYGSPSLLATQVNSATQITLMWYQSSDAPGNIDGYRIYRNNSAIGTVGSSGTTPSFVDSSLTCGTLYSYTVRAYKGSLESANSNTASGTTTGCPPDPPINLTVGGATQSSITLNWQDNSNNENGFKIYRWGYDGAQWTFIYLASVGANVTTYTQASLNCGTDFNYYEVSAYNNIGESAHAGWVQGTTSACSPSDLAITATSVEPASPFTNDDMFYNVTVSNLSSIDAPGFWIDFYIDHTPTGCNDWGTYSGWQDGLAANSTANWYIRVPANNLTTGTHQFRAYADSGCAVTENNKSNNISNAASFTLTLPSSSPPAHDDFDAARLISAVPYNNSTVDVSGATTALDDPYVPDCGGVELTPGMTSVWYKYTPSVDTKVNLDTFGSNYDTYIAVWTGVRGSLTSTACNDDYDHAGGNYQSGLQVNLTAGTTYYFEVAEYGDSFSIASTSAGKGLRTAGIPAIESKTSKKAAPNVGEQAGGTLNFHVSSKPSAATLTTPSGNIVGNYTPTYTWNDVTGSTWYWLWVDGPSGNVIQQWYTSAQANCNGTTCSITPTTTLAIGTYTWKVQTYNSLGNGPWSASLTFSITPPPVPGKATLSTPSGNLGTNYNPTYTWNQVADSTWYYLWVDGPSGNVIQQWYTSPQANCNGMTCAVTPSTTLAGGAYTWKVQTWNATGYGQWSSTMPFSSTVAGLPGLATLVTPTGSVGTNYNPTYTWNQVAGSTWYQFSVDKQSGGNVILQWYTSAQANCNGTTCSVTPSTTLAGGTAYTWKVMTYNSSGNGPWSSMMSFSTSASGLPGAATLVTPTGSVGTNYNPTYSWNQVTGSTWYQFSVDKQSGGNVILQWYTSAQAACNGSTCSVTPATALAGGTAYTWKVQTYNASGNGPWSTPMSISTGNPVVAGAATLVTPNGSIGVNHNPTYTWNQVTGSTWYYLWVNGPSGTLIQQWYMSAQANCNGTTCSVTPSTTLAGGAYTWWVETYTSAGNGPWSSAMNFTVSP